MSKAIIFVAIMMGISALADDITTLDGTAYHNVKVISSDPISIIVYHSTGVGRILFKEMDMELQKKYGYDATNAVAYMDQLKAKSEAQVGKQSTDNAKPFVEKTNAPSQNQPADQPTRKAARSINADTGDHSGEKLTGDTTRSGQSIYEGPRGGHYHYSASGNKVYERKK